MVNQSTSLNLLERLRTFLELGRISNLPTVFTNLILGVALAKGTLSYYEYVLLFIYGCSFYVARSEGRRVGNEW